MQELQLTRKTAAYKIHMDILAAGEVAAESFSTFCRLLKTMRDDKLYQELEYSSFEAYCENAVGIKQRQAYNYIRALETFGEENLHSSAKLGVKKLELLAAAPTEAREELLDKADEMTTREIEQAVKEYKQKLEDEQKARAEAQAAAAKSQEWADKQAKYAEESNKRAREAEWELDKQEKSLSVMRSDLDYAKRQLEDAKKKGNEEVIKKFQDTINFQLDKLEKLEEDKEDLLKQLHAKPIEAQAARVVEEKVVEKEVIPNEVRTAIYSKVAGLYEGLIRLTEKEIKIFSEDVVPDYYDDVIEQIRDAVLTLDKIENSVNDVHGYKEPAQGGRCENCSLSDADKVNFEEYEEGKTWCLMRSEIVERDGACRDFEE
jgi:hypothetical protein